MHTHAHTHEYLYTFTHTHAYLSVTFHERVLTTKQIQQHEVIKDAILYPRIHILIFNALLSKT